MLFQGGKRRELDLCYALSGCRMRVYIVHAFDRHNKYRRLVFSTCSFKGHSYNNIKRNPCRRGQKTPFCERRNTTLPSCLPFPFRRHHVTRPIISPSTRPRCRRRPRNHHTATPTSQTRRRRQLYTISFLLALSRLLGAVTPFSQTDRA